MRHARTARDWRRRRGRTVRALIGDRRARSRSRNSTTAPPERWLSSLIAGEELSTGGAPIEIGARLGSRSILYIGSSMHRLRARILAAIRARAGVFLVTGAAGVGKSVFVRWLTQDLRAAGYPVVLADQPVLTARPLLGELARQLGLPVESGKTPSAWTRALSDACAERDIAAAVLLLDHADVAGDALFLELRPYLDARGCVLRVVLVGRGTLRTRFEAPGLATIARHVTFRDSLDALDERELLALVHQDTEYSSIDRGLIRPELGRALARHAAGRPDRAALLWSRALAHARGEGRVTPRAEHIEWAATLLGPGIAVPSLAHTAPPPAQPIRPAIAPSPADTVRRAAAAARAAAGLLSASMAPRQLAWGLSGMAAAAIALMLTNGPAGELAPGPHPEARPGGVEIALDWPRPELLPIIPGEKARPSPPPVPPVEEAAPAPAPPPPSDGALALRAPAHDTKAADQSAALHEEAPAATSSPPSSGSGELALQSPSEPSIGVAVQGAPAATSSPSSSDSSELALQSPSEPSIGVAVPGAPAATSSPPSSDSSELALQSPSEPSIGVAVPGAPSPSSDERRAAALPTPSSSGADTEIAQVPSPDMADAPAPQSAAREPGAEPSPAAAPSAPVIGDNRETEVAPSIAAAKPEETSRQSAGPDTGEPRDDRGSSVAMSGSAAPPQVAQLSPEVKSTEGPRSARTPHAATAKPSHRADHHGTSHEVAAAGGKESAHAASETRQKTARLTPKREAPAVAAQAPSPVPVAAPAAAAPVEVATVSGGPRCTTYRANVDFTLSGAQVHGVACRGADGQWWLMNQKSG